MNKQAYNAERMFLLIIPEVILQHLYQNTSLLRLIHSGLPKQRNRVEATYSGVDEAGNFSRFRLLVRRAG